MQDVLLNKVCAGLMKKELPSFKPGDSVRILFKLEEGQNQRTQVYEGTVIARSGAGISETFTIRKISYGVGVEITFPVHSPCIEKIEILKPGRVRRAKLYYLRKKVGKKAKVKEART